MGLRRVDVILVDDWLVRRKGAEGVVAGSLIAVTEGKPADAHDRASESREQLCSVSTHGRTIDVHVEDVGQCRSKPVLDGSSLASAPRQRSEGDNGVAVN